MSHARALPAPKTPTMTLAAALLLASSAHAHITMNPNYGADSGGYMMTHIKVPHGHRGLHTTKFVLHVPRGVASARPEVPAGWSVAVAEYDLAEEDRYTSHGNPVTTGPDKITWTADTTEAALDDKHLMNIGLQLKLLCSFNDPVGDDYSGSNSIWQGQHTLWFKIEQHSSAEGSLVVDPAHIYRWSGALKDKELELQRAKETLVKQELSTESRDERVTLLQGELEKRADEILALRIKLGQKEEELKGVNDGPLVALQEQLAAAQSEARLAGMQRDDKDEAIQRLQKVLERRQMEVHTRGEQLRISHESAMLLTLESTLKDERLQSVTESLTVERARNEREAALLKMAREENEAANATVLDLTSQLTRERERGSVLELKLVQRDEQAFALIEELRSAEVRGDGKEARLALLRTKAMVASEERELFDTRLSEFSTRISRHESE